VEGAAAAVNKHVMPSETVPRLNPPFEGITSILAADGGADADADAGADTDAGTDPDAGADSDAGTDAGTDPDAGSTIADAGPDASQSGHTNSPGSVDLATFKKNAANAMASAQKEATSLCLRPGIKCSGRVSFRPEGTVGSALITCAGLDGNIDDAVTRCGLPIFKKKSIPPLAKPATSTGVNVSVGPFSK
jgi:hypothetical protein